MPSDKERLNWLSRKETAFYKTVGGYQLEQGGHHFGGLRKVIDAAIRAEKKGRR